MGEFLIAPIEKIPSYLDEDTDGSLGENRHPDSGRTSASNDHEAVMVWLKRFDSTPNTQTSYRKEIERLYLWAINRGMALSDLKLEDLEEYKQFLSDPQPQEEWCGPAKARTEEDWRPFIGKLSAASRNQSLTILNTCFSFLTQMGYLKYNPLKLLFKRDLRQQINKSGKIDRYLEHDLWDYLWDFIKKYKPQNDKDALAHQRRLFLFGMLYLLAPRLSEVANHTMESFMEERGKWWWEVTGKGNKTAKIPVPKSMMETLKSYREFLGLSSFPHPGDTRPLISALDSDKALSSKMIYLIVKDTVAEAAVELESRSPHKAEKLRRSSTHWFRHTSITHQADKGVDIRHLQASARHASITTTQRYMHKEEDTWHKDIDKHDIKS
ncbi:MAG: site-specific integrase [Candidatus Portiera sp.]|nr:site-specific integrase [Portiera sp.]